MRSTYMIRIVKVLSSTFQGAFPYWWQFTRAVVPIHNWSPQVEMVLFQSSADYRGGSIIAVNSCLIGLSTVFVLVRLYSRKYIIQNIGLDDGVACLAYVRLKVYSQAPFVILFLGLPSS